MLRNEAGNDQVHRFVQFLYISFQRKPQFGRQLPILPPLAAFKRVYTALGAWTGPPGLEAGPYYTPRVGDFINVCTCKRKRKQQQNDADMNIMEKLPFYFDTAITGVWWHLEVLPNPQPRGLQQINLLPEEHFRLNTKAGWGKG